MKNLNNQIFGYLTVIDDSMHRKRKSGQTIRVALTECKCGTKKLIDIQSLLSNNTLSCGCYNKRHGFKSKEAPYKAWAKIKSRCNNPNHEKYHRWGGRGIKVEFKDYQEFLLFYNKPHTSDMTIDRIDNNKGYSLENCKWSTSTEQANNRTNTILYKGLPLLDFLQKNNIEHLRKTITNAKNRYNYTIEEAIQYAVNNDKNITLALPTI